MCLLGPRSASSSSWTASARKALSIYILAWDFHLVFALEREWMQKVLFHWMTNPRFHFLFDDCRTVGGSHHQKFIVIDGTLAFLGGMDVCEARWDDRRHLAHNPVRLSHGKPQKPYHDVQTYFVGEDAAKALTRLFLDRWVRAGGESLTLPESVGAPPESGEPRRALALGATRVAFSRTDPQGKEPAIREIEQLFVDAIEAAERLIYVETQHFRSRIIYDALVSRMRAAGRSRLEIVVVTVTGTSPRGLGT